MKAHLPQDAAQPCADGQAPLSPARRRTITGLLLLHIAALVVGPASVEPASQLTHALWKGFRPYLDGAYLNHGYHFFAPEPGPSHLVRYELELPGGQFQRGFFPDRSRHRPRLLYHRYFMLSEHLANLAAEEPPSAALAAYSRSFARHLLKEHGAQRVRLYLVRHSLPKPGQVLAGMALDDASLYQERLLIDDSAGES